MNTKSTVKEAGGFITERLGSIFAAGLVTLGASDHLALSIGTWAAVGLGIGWDAFVQYRLRRRI